MKVGDLIRLNARARPNAEALICGSARLSYRDFNARINRTAHTLRAQGIAPGQRVAVLGHNSIAYSCLFFALAKIGAVLVPLNYWQRAPEIAFVLGDSEPSLILHEPQYSELMRSAMEGITVRCAIFDPGAADDLLADGIALVDDDSEPDGAVEENAAHLILYTSGTTGRPKGAVLSHRRTVQDALAMVGALSLRSSDTYVGFFPSFHTASWDHQKLFWLIGARVVLLPHFDAGAALQAMARERVTAMLGVPTMFRALLAHPDFAATDLSALRLVYFGAYDPSGIMLHLAYTLGAREGRIEMIHTYGLTEAGPFVTTCPPGEVFDHWGSIGRPIPGVEVALLDDDCQEVPLGGAGEICIRGPHMTGYWRNPAATEAALAGGWMHTGDVAVADADGYLRIVDRKKDVIRSGGHNIFSKEVEDCLVLHPAVADAAVIGLFDPVYEERVCAVLVLAEGAQADAALKADIAAFVRANSAGYNTPKEIVFTEQLPKSAVGKTLKHMLRAQLSGRASAVVGKG